MINCVLVKFVTVPAPPSDLPVLPGFQKSGSNAGNCNRLSNSLVRAVQTILWLQEKVDIKNLFFCEVKQLYLVQVFDFETVPALPRSSGPPRPSGKRRQRRQPRTYIKLSGQTSTKDLRSILLLHEFDSKKIFTIIKIIGRPLNLLFLTFDFFSLRASRTLLQ